MKPAAIDVEGLTVSFNGMEALSDVTFSVPASSFMAIIGPNGGGKSTLLHVLVGLLRPDRGSISVFGQPPQKSGGARVAYVPQKKTFAQQFPATIIELVVSGITGTWPWRITASQRAHAIKMLERAGVAHLSDQPVQQVSGGELQRAFLARSLATAPDLLVLDEPAAGMDLKGEAAMYHILCDYQADTGATVIMITHDWEGARYHADQVMLLDGHVIAYGPAREVASEARLLALFGHRGHVHHTHVGPDDD